MTLRNLERRFKIAYLPDHALLSCLSLTPTVPGDCLVKSSLNVPPGTIAVSRHYDYNRQADAVILWNESWPILDQADLLPEIKVENQYIMVKGDVPRRESSCDQPLIRNAGSFTVEVRNEAGVCVKRMTFENPISVKNGETLVISGFNLDTGEIVGEHQLTGRVEKVTDENGNVGFKVPLNVTVHNHYGNPCKEIILGGKKEEKEFFHEALGEPHTNPFEKTWREKEPLL